MKTEYIVECRNTKYTQEWNPAGYEEVFDTITAAENYLNYRRNMFGSETSEYRICSREVSDWKVCDEHII